MDNVGLILTLDSNVDKAEAKLDRFYASVQQLAKNIQSTFASMGGTAASVNNMFKPVSDGARNATKTVIDESRARQQVDKEETQAALNASRLRVQSLREEQAAQRAATQAKNKERDEYGKLVDKVQALTREYYNASAAAIANGDKSEETAKKLDQMAQAAKRGNDQLKQIEAGAGRFQRNVGNYSGATQYLSQTIAQLTGELPNFFQSLKIGFMSIGNNIQPILFALEALTRENAELAAQGLATKSALEAVTKSLFGWQTLLFIGVGLISAYGGKLVDMITGADEAKEKAKELKQRQDELNNAFESGASSASKQIVAVQSLAAEMTNSNTPLSKKIDLYNQIIAQYPQLDTGTGTWSDKISNLASVINTELIPALRKQAIMQGYAAQAAKLGQELASKSADSASLLAKRNAARAIIELSPKPSISAFRDAAAAEKAYSDNENAIKDLNRELNAMIQNQVSVSQELDKTILSHQTYKEQLQNTVKAEQARLDVLKAGTPEYEKQYDILQKAKNALKAYDPPLKDTKVRVDALTKSQNNLNAEFKDTDARLKAGLISTFDALKERASAIERALVNLFKNGGDPKTIDDFISQLQRLRFAITSLQPIDLNSAKGNLFGGNAEKEFRNYIEGVENVKKRTKELAEGFYDTLGIQDPRDAIKRRQLDTELSDKGIDTSAYLDPNKNAKGQAKDLDKTAKDLNREFNKTYSQLNQIVGGPLDGFTRALFEGENALDAIGNAIKNVVEGLVAAVVKAGAFSLIMSAINPTSFAAGGGFLGVLGKLLPFATGGIVTGPTPALVGEAGPEAIIPLNKINNVLGNRDITVNVVGKTKGRDLVYTGDNYNKWVNR